MQTNPTQAQDYRIWLQTEFTNRQRKNVRYSLRAFARLVDMDPSTVSQLLSGKRRASKKVITQLCDRLSARPEIRESLLASVSEREGSEAAAASSSYSLIAADTFAVMADWYHFAILDMPFTKGFKSDPEWIARKLGLSVTETRVAIERLIRLGLLKMHRGRLIKTEAFLSNYNEGDTSVALRELQRQILQQALRAIDQTPPPEKDLTSMTMAIDPTRIPEAKKRIKKFRRELCEFLEKGERTRMYQLAVQLFPVSDFTNFDEDED